MASIPNQLNFGAFIPTTGIFDTETIMGLDLNSDEYKRFLVLLNENINNIALVLNLKHTGYYTENEFLNGKLFYPRADAVAMANVITPTFRQVFSKTINFGALPNAASKSMPHGIDFTDNRYQFTHVYGCATYNMGIGPYVFVSSLPIPNSDIHLEVTATDVVITTVSDLTDYQDTDIVLEYTKQ